jgi:superfamily I DNA/RNA helicase
MKMKKQFSEAGYATQTDAAYWAVRVLEQYPGLAKALVRRFPELLIDEAQDTSHAQMKIIDLLVAAGLKEVVLVGDPDQAVYEWRTAHPELFLQKISASGWEKPLNLTENKRSSQAICDATHPFSTLPSPSKGREKGKRPQTWFFDEGDPHSVVDRFVEMCAAEGIDATRQSIAVLVRGRTLLRRILKLSEDVDPWLQDASPTRPLACAAWERDRGRPKDARRWTEVSIIYLLGADPKDIKLEDLIGLRSGVRSIGMMLHRLTNSLPETSLPLNSWVSAARQAFETWAATTGWSFSPNVASMIAVKAYRLVKGKQNEKSARTTDFLDRPVASYFDAPISPHLVTVETVHSAKGKTYEAVLLALSKYQPCTVKVLAEAGPDSEERRTAYVAMTRPRSLLVVAVPNGTKEQNLARFGGFDIVKE